MDEAERLCDRVVLLHRDAVGLALVRSATPGVNATTAVYLGVTGVDELHETLPYDGVIVHQQDPGPDGWLRGGRRFGVTTLHMSISQLTGTSCRSGTYR